MKSKSKTKAKTKKEAAGGAPAEAREPVVRTNTSYEADVIEEPEIEEDDGEY